MIRFPPCPCPMMSDKQMTEKKEEIQPGSQLLIYQSEDGQTRLEVQLQEETGWGSSISGFIGKLVDPAAYITATA